MLALERGGQCHGVAYRIAPAKVHSETEIVWRREMISGIYRAQWVTVRTPKGPRRAVTFVVNRGHTLYAGRIPRRKVAHHIAFAEGRNGTCRDYLVNTMQHLQQLGIVDREMNELSRLVRHARADAPPPEIRPGLHAAPGPVHPATDQVALAASQNSNRDVV
jgi:cation transport protein ChaC